MHLDIVHLLGYLEIMVYTYVLLVRVPCRSGSRLGVVSHERNQENNFAEMSREFLDGT